MKTLINFKKIICFLVFSAFAAQSVSAGITVFKSNGMRFTGADGIDFIGTNGMRFTGADGFLSTETNGVRFTGADGTRFTGADGMRFTGADGATYTAANGARFTGADGLRFTGADGMRFTGADGFRFTGADGTIYRADSIIVRHADGVEVINPNGIRFTGADGLRFTGADALRFTGADGMRFTGADALRFTGADSITGFDTNGFVFNVIAPTGVTLTGADGARFTGADVSLTQVNDIYATGVDGARFTGADGGDIGSEAAVGLQSVDPQLALLLNRATDDSSVNAVVVFHQYPTAADLNRLQQIGIVGGTLFRRLPMVYVTATRAQLMAISELSAVRSIYGNRTLQLNSDPFYKITQLPRVAPDRDLQTRNSGMPVSGRNVTVAVLDTGVNSLHGDLSGRVVQNVRLIDAQSIPIGFINPAPVENLANTDLVSGHGTFVSGIIAGSGANSGGKYGGVAPGANILGLSAGDLNLIHVLSGFDYLLDRAANYNARVVNCSFSADTIFDFNDPVNVATKLLTDNNISVVFSAGNTGAGNGSLNPYAAAPWVVSVGATDEKGVLADFSSRGVFGSDLFAPTLSAPGVNVVSLRSLGTETGTLGVGGGDVQRLTPGEMPFYTTASGTSFSAPQVAGAIALMLEANPNLTPAQIKNILQRSATPLPNNYRHEVGAGMLDTYAAVLEAAFPTRKTGTFRAVLDSDAVSFVTSTTQMFGGSVAPNSIFTSAFAIPANAIQSSVYIASGSAANPGNLGLKVYDANGNLRGESNQLDIADLTGRNRRVSVKSPTNFLQVQINYALGGAAQNFLGAVETTTIQYTPLNDIGNLSAQNQSLIYEGLRKFALPTAGANFYPAAKVSRADLAAAFVRLGKVPQFVAKNPMYADVTDLTTRNAVESVQANPNGSLIFDAANGTFRPDQSASRLVLAIALVKAAQMENLAAASTLPLTVTDANSIPLQWRGYVAVAVQKGWLNLSNNRFNPNDAVTKSDLNNALLNSIR